MPTNITRIRRQAVPRLTRYQLADLLDRELPAPSDEDTFWRYCQRNAGREDGAWEPWSARCLWVENEAELLQEWMATDAGAGCRPDAWWRYRAPRAPLGTHQGVWYDGPLPEPRRRLGGTGTPRSDVLADVPMFCLGVPARWLTVDDFRTWPQLAARGAEAYDPADPPLFESQASYLERHGLLLPGEHRLLRKDDFEPERLDQIIELSAKAGN
jgi:hypothetical protein